jgi:soluble lytic murein transglycosylase
MPPALAALPEWTYWLGRAYKAGGMTTEADALFQKVAGQPNFYGNLADDELERPINVPPQAAALTREEILGANGNPGLKRALALLRVNMRVEGVREWNWTLRGMSDRELLAAAELAKRNDVYDRAIAAADRTRNEHNYSLRYLAPFDDQVRPAAQKQAVDDAWVYGLMRQESRFITNAKSTVGASGLMQLMPATAKWVANKIGLANYSHSRVNDTDVNLLLGTSYMRMVMESLDNHPVLASAAYNAGPGRARRWRADRPLEGAIYAETIPFNETRDYVKKVMSNSVYYSALFEGKPQSLKPRLGIIGPRADAPKGEELP